MNSEDSAKSVWISEDAVTIREKNVCKREISYLNCRNRFETALKRFSSMCRWTLKKISSKNIFSSWRKIILKIFKKIFLDIFEKFFEKSIFSKIEKSKEKTSIFPRKFPDFFFEKKSIFFLKIFKKTYFFKLVFFHDEKIFFDGIF